jgi:hypothetical protein
VSSDNQSVGPATLALDIIPYNNGTCGRSAEQTFSKLKLLKSYMCTMMTQQRLNDLATISLESEMLEKINYEDITENFILKNPNRIMLFT